MKEIPLGGGLLAVVDDCDWDAVKMHHWYAYKGRRGTMYVATKLPGNACVALHRFILRPAPNQQVDHIDRNGLDCRRKNLRVCSASQNQANKVSRSDCKNPYKGITFNKKRHRWVAQITKDYKNYNLGMYTTAVDAACAYDDAAVEMFGDFARINFPERKKSVVIN